MVNGTTTPESVRDFCAQEWPRLVGALGLYTGDLHLAEEFAQEALTRACRDWHRVGAMQAPGAWVHRVAINVANSHFRRWQARRRAEARMLSEDIADHWDAKAEEAISVRAAVLELPPRRRAAVVLRFYLGYSTADAAQLLGVTEATVRSLLHRAIGSLRESLALVSAGEDPDA